MANIRTSFKSDLAWGLKNALGIAVVLSLVVAIIDAATHGDGTARVGVGIVTIVASYLVSATLAGLLFGAARPYLRGTIASAIICVLAAWPFTFLLALTAGGLSESLQTKLIDATVLSLMYGLGGSFVLRRAMNST